MQRSLDSAIARRRGTTEIIAEILSTASDKGATKTSLVYKTNLNFTRMERYIEFLIRKNFISRVDSEAGSLYKTTERGKEALKILTDAKIIIFS